MLKNNIQKNTNRSEHDMHSSTGDNIPDHKDNLSFEAFYDLFNRPVPESKEDFLRILDFVPNFFKCLEDDGIYDEKSKDFGDNGFKFDAIVEFITWCNRLPKHVYPPSLQPKLLNQKIYAYLQRVFSLFKLMKCENDMMIIVNNSVRYVMEELIKGEMFQECLNDIIIFLERQNTYDTHAWIVALCIDDNQFGSRYMPFKMLFFDYSKRESLDDIYKTIVASVDHPHHAFWLKELSYYLWKKMNPIAQPVRPFFG